MLDVLSFLAIDDAEPRLHDDVRLAIAKLESSSPLNASRSESPE